MCDIIEQCTDEILASGRSPAKRVMKLLWAWQANPDLSYPDIAPSLERLLEDADAFGFFSAVEFLRCTAQKALQSEPESEAAASDYVGAMAMLRHMTELSRKFEQPLSSPKEDTTQT